MERWLSLTVLKSSPSVPPRVHFSIPKRVVPRAVARNRIKRVLREAVRRDPFFGDDRIYRLRVNRMPEVTDLKTALAALRQAHA